MKIDQSTSFLKPMAEAPPSSSTKEGVNNSVSVSRVPAPTSQEQALSATLLLPSIEADFDSARVDKIRDDISAGRYKVNTEKIADGLITSVRDLIARKST